MKKPEVILKNANADQGKVVVTSVSHASLQESKQVLLATVVVKIIIADNKGKEVLCRTLLDSGSQSCFIISNCVERLTFK